MAFFDGWPPEMTTSMHHDLQQGKRLELQWLSGGVVDLGAEVGVPTPMNRAVRDVLALHAQGGAGLEPARADRQERSIGTKAKAGGRHSVRELCVHAPGSLNSFIAFVLPILRRSASV